MTPFYNTFPFIKSALLICGFVCLIYSQTLDSAWIMDDYGNILDNPRIQMNDLNPASLKASLYATPSFENTLYRPVSNLSLALNWLWGKDEVTGYHVVNIFIHIITALLLYLVLIQILQTPNVGKMGQDRIYFIALLSTLFWVIHPIQIQAVTYIVQRMASLAALFYTMGILCFLKARMTPLRSYRIIFIGLCGLSFILGIGSKNNAILLPAFLLLIEFIFFRDLSSKKFQKKAIAVLFITGLLIAVAGVLLFFENGFSQILDPYEVKPFSMGQRLLTQPTVLLFYLSQIFYPVAHRFSIVHDVTYATSLFHPWYTFFSIAMVMALIGFALWRIRKNPIVSFAVLFYFGNHIIESTILPLEMIFEHRNYLPSLFLFVPVVMGMEKMLAQYRSGRRPMYFLMVFFIMALISGVGFSTYVRNLDWQSAKSLWQDAAQKAPGSARPLHNLAWAYYESVGQYEKALELYQAASNLRDDQAHSKAVLYTNMAGIYFYRLKDYSKAFDHAGKALEILPDSLPAHLILNNSLAMQGQYENVLSKLDLLLESHSSDPRVHHLKASVLMKILKFDPALSHLRQCIKLDPGNWVYLRNMGICLTQMGYYDRGYWFLNRAKSLDAKQIDIYLALADNRLKKCVSQEAVTHIKSLIQIVGVEHIEKILEDAAKDPIGEPFDFKGLFGIIAEYLDKLSDIHKKAASRMVENFQNSR